MAALRSAMGPALLMTIQYLPVISLLLGHAFACGVPVVPAGPPEGYHWRGHAIRPDPLSGRQRAGLQDGKALGGSSRCLILELGAAGRYRRLRLLADPGEELGRLMVSAVAFRQLAVDAGQ